ncbi:hypothetical protein ABT040_41500 [Streptomyces sp. NPDC002688]|uniref:hypothetical protein n=1 Tax=Streptomyces sp. NPDC002688 TaxID=3154423 RepID=UPI00333083FB
MHLARVSVESAAAEGWPWALGAVALYGLISYGLQYRARARRGSRHPGRDALHDLKDREEPQSSGQHVISRVLMFGGGAAIALVALTTSGVVRIVAAGLTAVIAVSTWAYYDHRAEARSLDRRG